MKKNGARPQLFELRSATLPQIKDNIDNRDLGLETHAML